jgi:hypothetical protein
MFWLTASLQLLSLHWLLKSVVISNHYKIMRSKKRPGVLLPFLPMVGAEVLPVIYHHKGQKRLGTSCWKGTRNKPSENVRTLHAPIMKPHSLQLWGNQGREVVLAVCWTRSSLGRNIWVMLVWMKPSGTSWSFGMNIRELSDSAPSST